MRTIAVPRIEVAKQGKWGLSPFAMILVAVEFVVAGYEAYHVKWPPYFEPNWALIWLLSGAAMVTALMASWGIHSRRCQILSGASILFAFLFALPSIASYQGSFQDYPWILLLPALSVIVAGWFCRQRLVMGSLLLFLIYWFHGAVVPPSGVFPRTIQQNGLTFTLSEVPGGPNSQYGLFLKVSAPPGKDIDSVCNTGWVEASGNVGGTVPIKCWATEWHPFPDEPPYPANEAVVLINPFVADWPHSWDLDISLPTWPKRKALQLTVPVPQPGDIESTKDYEEKLGDAGLRITGAHLARTTHQLPEENCLSMTVSYWGSKTRHHRAEMIRFSDESGKVLKYEMAGAGMGANEGSFEAEIPLEGKAPPKSIRVEFWPEEIKEISKIKLHFDRLPN